MDPAIRFKCPCFKEVWVSYIHSKKTLSVRHGKEGEYFQGISYYSLSKDIEEKILKVLPEKLRSEFEVSLMVVNAREIPYVDNKCKAAINFYMKSGSGKTLFYDEHETFSFSAKEDEAWILDTSVPHIIKCENLTIAFVLQSFKHSYEEVCSFFKN